MAAPPAPFAAPSPAGPARPLVGILCCNEHHDRAVQVVASRFVEPLVRLAGATVLLVPALPDAADAGPLAAVLDGLLLTGSRSHVAPERYGAAPDAGLPADHRRDEVALALAGRMIGAGKPVFGICRGLQELNVLFGGTLAAASGGGRHHRGPAHPYEALFDLRHEVELAAGGRLAAAAGRTRLFVNSVHEQAIDRLGTGLAVEARACDDGIVEAVAARPCGADVLAVQWHPEWEGGASVAGRAFFGLVRTALHG